MIVKLDTQRLQTLDQIREFVAGSRPLDLQPETRAEAYAFVAETLQRFDYSRQGKADKGLIRRFLNKVTGLSRAQLTRLLHQHRTTGPSPTAAAPGAPSHAATPRPTSGCSLKSMPSTAPSPVRPPASSASEPCSCSATSASRPRRHLQRTPLQPAPLDR